MTMIARVYHLATLFLLAWATSTTMAFTLAPNMLATARGFSALASSSETDQSSSTVELLVDLPPSGSGMQAQMKFEKCLSVPSEIVVVRYAIPFELSVEPRNNLAICTKDGKGGEQVGDVLRFSSQWSLGLPQGDGLVTTAAAFSGGLKWGCSMFDVLKAQDWRQVVEALTTNVPDRTDEVLLIFERPMEDAPETA